MQIPQILNILILKSWSETELTVKVFKFIFQADL